ncbi:MAG TPA: DUF177 domain-containing protein [Acidimicrobiales bacterium]|nr:DUF177 domain-containing protein [Acidimicrobiales bacterium]
MTDRHRDLQLTVADLLRHPGANRSVTREAVLDGLAVTGSRVPDGAPVRLELELQAVNDGIVATGTVRAPWRGECRRCLKEAAGEVAGTVQEIFERDPVEGETRRLRDATIDLTEVARDAVLLELPIAPLCRDDCAGLCPTCGADRNEADCGCEPDTVDPRWAALEQITFDE